MCTAVLLRSSLTRKAHPRRPPFLRNLRKSWTPIRNCSRLGTRRGNRSPWFTLLQLRRMLKPSSTSSTVVSRRRGEGRRHVGRRLIGPRKSTDFAARRRQQAPQRRRHPQFVRKLGQSIGIDGGVFRIDRCPCQRRPNEELFIFVRGRYRARVFFRSREHGWRPRSRWHTASHLA